MKAIPILLTVLALAAPAVAVERITYGLDALHTWQYPAGLVTFDNTGVQARRFGKASNAASTIDEFRGLTLGVHGTAPVRTQSNAATIDLVRDGDPNTWWAPSPADPLDRWWIELDLGRTVVADKLRLIFPDNDQAHPLTYFAVLTSPGVAILGNAENLFWTRIDRPGEFNTETVVEYNLSTEDTGTAIGDYLVGNKSTPHPWSLVRFIRIEAEAQPPGGALAEIEVREIGFNVATRITTEYRVEEGLEVWGGNARTSDTREDEFRADGSRNGKAANPESLISSDLAGRHWAIESQNQPDWRSSGSWWILDMGSIFRIDRLIWLPVVQSYSPLHYGYARDKTGRWKLFDFLFSDGTPDNEANVFVEGPYDYQLLSSVDNCVEDANKNCTRSGQSYFDFQFPAQPMRYLMWRRMSDEQLSKALQVWVFHAEGYPAQVEFESDDMDLGGARSVATVEWEADAPPGTRIEVLTQTGNGFAIVTRYYDAANREVTKDAWELLKTRNRGPVVEERVRDDSWSSWSEPHRVSGERFLSPTPRRWLRVRVHLISEDPDLFPSLRGISFLVSEPVINAGVSGVILPREAALDSLQEFTYTLSPVGFGAQDLGFDRILVMVPAESGEAIVTALRIGGRPVTPNSTEFRGDSLIVSLPSSVRRDTVELSFMTRVYHNPTVFDAFVSNSSRPDEVQGVVPAGSGTDQVYVPEVFGGGSYFRNVAYSVVFTPNRDGINDELVLTFNYIRASRTPEVEIYRLDGSWMAMLAPTTPLTGRARYVWDGTDASGNPVPPGAYLMRLRVETDAADESVVRLVHVVY